MAGPTESTIAVQEGAADKKLRTLSMLVSGQTVQVEYVEGAQWTVALAYDANGNLQYVGWARPGTAKSAAEWRIIKLTYDASAKLTDVGYAGGLDTFVNVWDSRATYTYT
jgi:YD repeat-containing protein